MLFNVTADNVTIDGMKLVVNQPNAVAGVYITNPNTGLTVSNNTITISGSYTGGAATGYVGFGHGQRGDQRARPGDAVASRRRF